MTHIITQNLAKTYLTNHELHPILKGISLTIAAGEFVAITGPSGSGKSTLMHILGCLDRQTSGEYFLDGQNIGTATNEELTHIRNKKVGFIFQKFNLLTNLTALKNTALPQLYAGIDEQTAEKNAYELLSSLGLKDRIHHFPYQLSGGQQQRVAIARALINKPSLILADEPTGNLDSESGKTILGLLKELNTTYQVTMIIVTHEQAIANQTSRIIQLKDGILVH